jgi:hypothetical protein
MKQLINSNLGSFEQTLSKCHQYKPVAETYLWAAKLGKIPKEMIMIVQHMAGFGRRLPMQVTSLQRFIKKIGQSICYSVWQAQL